MTVLVTGASGHVGVNLVPEILRQGRAVRVLIHRSDQGLAGRSVERVSGDVCDLDSVRRAMVGVRVVFHLAAVISIDGDRGGQVTRINVDGARHVAQAARESGVERMIHCCSIHAFSQQPLDEPVDEGRSRVAGCAQAAYDRSKAAGEREVRTQVGAGLQAVIVHPTGIIGPNDFRPSRMGRVLLDLYHRQLPALVPGGFDWVDVRDVVAGLLAAEQRGRVGESYILNGHFHSVGELATMAFAVTGVPPPRVTVPMWLARAGAPFVAGWGRLRGREALYTGESLAALRAYRQICRHKATTELGYQPRSIQTTMRDCYASFRSTGMLAH